MEKRIIDEGRTEKIYSAESDWRGTEVVEGEVVPSFWGKCSNLFLRCVRFEFRVLLRGIAFISRVLAVSIVLFARSVQKFRTWQYLRKQDRREISEQSKCPGCGFHGCRLNFVRTTANEPEKKAMIEATCNRCSAKFYFMTLQPLTKWWREPEPEKPQASIRRVV